MKTVDQNYITLPKISIGMPIYNRPKSLRRVLEEIAGQTYQNLEIIVSDNASPDNEIEEVLKEFASRDDRIQYYCQHENLGMTNNFQFVLDKATGEFFMWASDDDWHKPTYVEELYNKLSNDSTAVVAFCDFDIRDEEGHPVLNYPDSYSALRRMTAAHSIARQIRFFLLGEGRAIPHAIYGLMAMKDIKDFSWTRHIKRYGEYGSDTLFIFLLLGRGRLALVERKLFGCTVNNQKHYGQTQKCLLSKKIRNDTQRIIYLISFFKIAKGWNRLLLLSVFPWKLSEVLFSIIVREPFQKVMQIVKRYRLG